MGGYPDLSKEQLFELFYQIHINIEKTEKFLEEKKADQLDYLNFLQDQKQEIL